MLVTVITRMFFFRVRDSSGILLRCSAAKPQKIERMARPEGMRLQADCPQGNARIIFGIGFWVQGKSF